MPYTQLASLVFEGAPDDFGINDHALPFDNLYLFLDGTEVGSLWLRRDATGDFAVTLGTFGPLPAPANPVDGEQAWVGVTWTRSSFIFRRPIQMVARVDLDRDADLGKSFQWWRWYCVPRRSRSDQGRWHDNRTRPRRRETVPDQNEPSAPSPAGRTLDDRLV